MSNQLLVALTVFVFVLPTVAVLVVTSSFKNCDRLVTTALTVMVSLCLYAAVCQYSLETHPEWWVDKFGTPGENMTGMHIGYLFFNLFALSGVHFYVSWQRDPFF